MASRSLSMGNLLYESRTKALRLSRITRAAISSDVLLSSFVVRESTPSELTTASHEWMWKLHWTI
ncbi:hypothetical protein L195_g045546 [Trifolium pratense]|uniref:Uncharacterized protein n=1 Tax=Trifolium pratense TaxID=57577 RepID=A0A2K3MF66_TRIPR|nr:hypothetical protein L195_g045546 [Trifolium pratense]